MKIFIAFLLVLFANSHINGQQESSLLLSNKDSIEIIEKTINAALAFHVLWGWETLTKHYNSEEENLDNAYLYIDAEGIPTQLKFNFSAYPESKLVVIDDVENSDKRYRFLSIVIKQDNTGIETILLLTKKLKDWRKNEAVLKMEFYKSLKTGTWFYNIKSCREL